jgi:thioredoxin 1
MEPIVDELVAHFEGNKEVQFIKVDAEESLLFKDAESKYQVLKIPTHVFLKNGEIVTIKHEYVPTQVMIDEINNLI